MKHCDFYFFETLRNVFQKHSGRCFYQTLQNVSNKKKFQCFTETSNSSLSKKDLAIFRGKTMEFTLEFRETSDFYQGLRSNKIDSIFMLHFTFKPTHFEREMEPNFAGKFQTDF